LERAVVNAMRLGLGGGARALAARLEARARVPNVIDLEGERTKRR
jgi:hypothetical protein